MEELDYDLFVIGGGSGGVRAARMAAGFGARVALAEERYFGGTCVNVGCIPKKLFVYASHFREEFRAAAGYGWQVPAPAFDWRRLRENKDAEIARLNGVYRRLLENAGVAIFEDRARLEGPQRVAVAGRSITAERILVATGGWPDVPDIPGQEHVSTSNEIFHLDALPERLLIVGGGYIAVEFAGIFHGLGVPTTQLYRRELFLRGFDEDLRRELAEAMRRDGVDLRFGVNVTRIDRHGEGLTATLTDGGTIEADCILYATGRRPLTGDLGLEAAGVRTRDNGAIIVDEQYRTNVPSIYAVGDVTDRVNLTPVALAEGMAFARNNYAGVDSGVDYEFVPSAVFSQPTIGTVGFTEAEARERFGDVAVFKSRFTPLKHSMTGIEEKTFMKMLVRRSDDRVVGVHMLGPEAGEIIQGLAVAMRAGATKTCFDTTIGIHPTAAEEFVTMREPAA